MLSIGISEVKIKEAIESYMLGKQSLEKAAESADVSIWRFLDLLRERKVPLRYSIDDVEREIKSIINMK